MLKLSILDQAPISTQMTAREALMNSVELAKLGDELGYTRFWLAEHHGKDGLSSSAPEVTLGGIGMVTKNIRLGSGATLLPYYKPYKVAELFNTLSTLYGDRIDIGIGRAPGGDNKVSEALSDNYLSHVFKMPELISELSMYISNSVEGIQAMPIPEHPPELWMLGTSSKSATFARDNNMNYCFGKFMSAENAVDVLNTYRENGNTSDNLIVTLNVFCAEDDTTAEKIAYGYVVNQALKTTGRAFNGIPSYEEAVDVDLTDAERDEIETIKSSLIIGSPKKVKEELEILSESYEVDEFMIVTITHDIQDKLNSYRLLGNMITR